MNKEVPLDKFSKEKDDEEEILVNLEKSDDEIGEFFEVFLDSKPLFNNKKVLQLRYFPETIPHREEQIKNLAQILAPALRQEKPSNLFIYGKTGTGKTLCIKHTLNKLEEVSNSRKIPLRTIYLNCKLKKIADTEYRVIAQLAREIGEDVPMTGLPTDEVYNLFLRALDREDQIILVVLDEVDQLVKKIGDGMLYTLTRINSELRNAEIAFIGISNDIRFMDDIDPRVKSSLGEEEMIFSPYNAIEIKDILAKRAEIAFKEEVLGDGVLSKCAAYAAREHGDARRALDLLRVAGEIAEREGSEKVESTHIDIAEEKIEKSRILEIINTQPKQSQLVMYAVLLTLEEKGMNETVETGEVFEHYTDICKQTGNNVLTQRRISDLISELDMLGLINAKLVSKGRYGRTREIYVTISKDMLEKVKTALTGELY